MEIKETVEFPGSVYWEDNVFPGFDPLSRRWMVEFYLDGVHVQALALNGDDGKIYLYRATADQFAESRRLRGRIDELEAQAVKAVEAGKAARRGNEKKAFFAKGTELRKQEGVLLKQLRVVHDMVVLAILAKEEVFPDPESLPRLNYKVLYNREPLPNWQQRYLYSDKIQIIDRKGGKIIAWSKRIERYEYILEVDVVGGRVLFGTVAGEGYILGFPSKILFEFRTAIKAPSGRNALRGKTYFRNLRGYYHARKY